MQDSDLNEYYSAPENILNISVCNPCTQTDGSEKYTDYEIICKVTIPVVIWVLTSLDQYANVQAIQLRGEEEV